MADRRARRGVPERLLLPPPPRERDLRERWETLPFERRRTLARTAAAELPTLPGEHREVVRGLAAARLATSWRLLAAAAVFGWLVLMTFWGFGRSTFPDQVATWRLAGIVLGALAWLVATVAVAARVRRARTVLAAART